MIDIVYLKEYVYYLNKYFQNEYVLIGSIIDTIEIETSISKDIDVLVTKQKFEQVFGRNKSNIKHENLDLSIAKFKSIFRPLNSALYCGYYKKNIKTDLFILDRERNKISHPLMGLDEESIKNPRISILDDVPIRLCSIEYRIYCLRYLLELSNNCSHLHKWTQDWLKNKQSTISNKLDLYYQKYPEFKLN